MAKQIVNERRFTDKTEEVVEDRYEPRMFSEGLYDVSFQVLDPIKSLCDLVLLNDRKGWPEAMEGDVAKILEALLDNARRRLDEWESAVEQHLGRVMVERASYTNEEHPPCTPLSVKVFERVDDGQEVDHG